MTKRDIRDALDILDEVDLQDGPRIQIYAKLQEAYNDNETTVSQMNGDDIVELHDQKTGRCVRVPFGEFKDDVKSLLNVVWYNQMRRGTRIYMPSPQVNIEDTIAKVVAAVDASAIVNEIGTHGNFRKIQSDSGTGFHEVGLDRNNKIKISDFASDAIKLRLFYELLHPYVSYSFGTCGTMIQRLTEWVDNSCGFNVSFIDYCMCDAVTRTRIHWPLP